MDALAKSIEQISASRAFGMRVKVPTGQPIGPGTSVL